MKREGINLVGVIIPTYNRRQFLQESLASVLNQSHQRLEVLVIDNGSTDGTAEFMDSVGDPRVRYLVNEQNVGLAGSINRGFSLFSENVQWCAILCDDDVLDASFVASAVQVVERVSAKSIVYGSINFFDSAGRPMRSSRPAPDEESAFAYLVNRLRCRRETYLSGVFVNCQAAREIGGYPRFRTGLVCDDAFIFALALRDRLCFAPAAQVNVRIHEGAESQETGRIVDHLQAIDDFVDYVIARAASVPLTAADEQLFRKKLQIYAQQQRGILWLRCLHSCLATSALKNNAHDLEKMYELQAGRNHEFPIRVGIAAFLWKWLKINVESVILYRKLCIGMVRLLRRFVW